MAKAILVLDEMPENCRECQFEDQDNFRRRNICNTTASDRVINDFGDEVDEDERPDWCPLKELPEKEECYPDMHDRYDPYDPFEIGYVEGWNACLDEIEKEGNL